MDRTGAARAVALVMQTLYFRKNSVDSFPQGELSNRKACFVLERTGAELAPGIDMDRVRAAPATKQPVVFRTVEQGGDITGLLLFGAELAATNRFQILGRDPVGQ